MKVANLERALGSYSFPSREVLSSTTRDKFRISKNISIEKSVEKTIKNFDQSTDEKSRGKLAIPKPSSSRKSVLRGSVMKLPGSPNNFSTREGTKSSRQLKFEIITPTQGMRKTATIFNDTFASKSLFLMSRAGSNSR